MAAHVVPRIDAAAPRIERAEVSAKQVRVEEPVTVQIRMQDADAAREFMVGIKGLHPKIRFESDLGLTTTLSVEVPGPRQLTMMVADAQTLLSAWATVSFEVTP